MQRMLGSIYSNLDKMAPNLLPSQGREILVVVGLPLPDLIRVKRSRMRPSTPALLSLIACGRIFNRMVSDW